MSNDTPYQIAPQVAQLQAERQNAVAYDNKPRVAQIDRQLADLGVKQEAAEKRAAASKGDDDAKKSAPKDRRSTQVQSTTAETRKSDG